MHGRHKEKRGAGRIALIFMLICIFAMTANAYTVVMRGGRRIEIPSQFVVTASTLTYETAPGIQVTLLMAAIDIPATEMANKEKPGSLLRRRQSEFSSVVPVSRKDRIAASAVTRRTITNRDLELSARRRNESESAYERRRKQLGLPSVAESRAQAAAESASLVLELEQSRIAEKESENYWRQRAAALRTEMAAMDAELAWIRARLEEGAFPLSNGWTNGSVTTVSTVIPFISFGNFGRRAFGNFGTVGSFPRPGAHRPGVFVAPRQDGRITGRVAFGGGATRGQVLVNPGGFPTMSPRGFGSRFPVFPNVGLFGSSIPFYDVSYERSELITRFNELGAARAGLTARWRELEEEARRAGAPPGWLRP
jgi:hypothetical protein